MEPREKWDGSQDDESHPLSPREKGEFANEEPSPNGKMKRNPFLSGSNSKDSKGFGQNEPFEGNKEPEPSGSGQKSPGLRSSAPLGNIKTFKIEGSGKKGGNWQGEEEKDGFIFDKYQSAQNFRPNPENKKGSGLESPDKREQPGSFGFKPSEEILGKALEKNNFIEDQEQPPEIENKSNETSPKATVNHALFPSEQPNEGPEAHSFEEDSPVVKGASSFKPGGSPLKINGKLYSPKQSEKDSEDDPLNVSRSKALESPSFNNEPEAFPSQIPEAERPKLQKENSSQVNNESNQPSLNNSKLHQNAPIISPRGDAPGKPDGKGIESQKSKGSEGEKEEEVVDIFAQDEEEEERKLRKNIFYRILENWVFSVFVGVITVYSLFSDDFKILVFEKGADIYFNVLNIIAFLVFSFEILAGFFGKPGYKWSFFFWLDLISTISIVLDITWIAESVLSGGG